MHFSDCPSKFNGKCLKNGTDVLHSIAFQTELNDVFFDYFGLIILAIFMHGFAFIGIRRNTRNVGYY